MDESQLNRARMDARQPDGLAPVVMHQRWSDLLFLHWRYPVEQIQATLPPGLGLKVDTFDRSAWVGVVPFAMRRVRPRGCPPLPWLSWFLELNVRTYVIGPDDRPGVWFYSLDANQPLAVALARRLFHLPYQHARMRSWRRDGVVRHHCRRRHAATPAHFRYRPDGRPLTAQAGGLEFFLIERYYLFAHDQSRGRLLRGQVHHQPYRICPVDCDQWSMLPLEWNGLRSGRADRAPDHACCAGQVDVQVHAPRTVDPCEVADGHKDRFTGSEDATAP